MQSLFYLLIILTTAGLTRAQVSTSGKPHSSSVARQNASFENALKAIERKDTQQALRILKPLSASGHPGAQVQLGLLYYEGHGGDKYMASFLFEKAALKGDPDGQLWLGIYHMERRPFRDFDTALRWLREASKSGSSAAHANICILAHAIEGGSATGRSCLIAAEAGYVEVILPAARHLCTAVGGAKGQDAVRWYREAVTRGLHGSVLELASIYRDGVCVSKDLNEAERLAVQSAKSGDAEAALFLADLLRNSPDSARDRSSEYFWLSLATSLGSRDADNRRQSLADSMRISEFNLSKTLARQSCGVPAPSGWGDFCRSLFVTGFEAFEPVSVHDLLKDNILSMTASGISIEKTFATFRSLDGKAHRVVVPVGTYLANTSDGQNMIVIDDLTVDVRPTGEASAVLEVVCANLHLPIPGPSHSFQIREKHPLIPLKNVLQWLRETKASHMAFQAATWIQTDNADYADLGTLVATGGMYIGRARQIYEGDVIMAVIAMERNEIDIAKFRIGKDRAKLCSGLDLSNVSFITPAVKEELIRWCR